MIALVLILAQAAQPQIAPLVPAPQPAAQQPARGPATAQPPAATTPATAPQPAPAATAQQPAPAATAQQPGAPQPAPVASKPAQVQPAPLATPAHGIETPAPAPDKPAAPAPQPALEPLQQAVDLAPLVPPAPEYTLALRQGEYRLRVTFRPGEPQPNRLLELEFDIARVQGVEAGDLQPFTDGKLALTVSGPGPRLKYLVRPLRDAGLYGVHWTPSARGIWTLTLAPYKDAGPTVSFQIGAGEPMPASVQGHMVQGTREVVTGGANDSSASMRDIMSELGRRWRTQYDAIHPDPAVLKAMARLTKAIPGHTPPNFAREADEFDDLAKNLTAMLNAQKVPSASDCLQCHVKFRDNWVADVSHWPEVRK